MKVTRTATAGYRLGTMTAIEATSCVQRQEGQCAGELCRVVALYALLIDLYDGRTKSYSMPHIMAARCW